VETLPLFSSARVCGIVVSRYDHHPILGIAFALFFYRRVLVFAGRPKPADLVVL